MREGRRGLSDSRSLEPLDRQVLVMCNNCGETRFVRAERFRDKKTPVISCPRCGDGRMLPPTMDQQPAFALTTSYHPN